MPRREARGARARRRVRALLVRVGADCTEAGGRWNTRSTPGRAEASPTCPSRSPSLFGRGSRRHSCGGCPRSSGSAPRLPAALRDRAHADRLREPDVRRPPGAGSPDREEARIGRPARLLRRARDVHDRRLVYGLIGLLTVEAIVAARAPGRPMGQERAHASQRDRRDGRRRPRQRRALRPFRALPSVRCAIPRQRVHMRGAPGDVGQPRREDGYVQPRRRACPTLRARSGSSAGSTGRRSAWSPATTEAGLRCPARPAGHAAPGDLGACSPGTATSAARPPLQVGGPLVPDVRLERSISSISIGIARPQRSSSRSLPERPSPSFGASRCALRRAARPRWSL